MAEQSFTATPVGAPDILRNIPLSRAVDVELETQILEPVTFNYNSGTGGSVRFVIPQKGVMDAPNTTFVMEMTHAAAANDTAYPLHIGGLSMIKTATLRCGGVIMSQVNNLNMYSVAKMQFKNQAVKEGIYDIRHGAHYKYRNRIQNAKIATIAGNVGMASIYNPELDQVDEFGNSYVGGANEHTIQFSKCLAQIAGQSFECAIKLADIFPILQENRLPTMAMAQVEVELLFERCGDGVTAAADLVECGVIESPIPANPAAAANQCVVQMSRPQLIIDFIHYDDEERAKISEAIDGPGGMQLNYTEVVHTRGRDAELTTAGTGAQLPASPVSSNTIIGMAMKEVKKIYVLKNWDLFGTTGTAERSALASFNAGTANQNLVFTHQNPVTRQFKSQQLYGESYNFLINNQKIFNRDVSNPALAHNYLSQCDRSFNVPLLSYDTMNYSQEALQHMLGSEVVAGVQAQNNTIGRTQLYVPGSCNVIGLNLDTYNELGSTPGNGLRIGSAPIEFNHSSIKIASNAGAGLGIVDEHTAPIIFDFFIEYRKSMIITPLGCSTSDV